MHPLQELLIRDIKIDISQMAEEGHGEKSLQKELDDALGSLDELAQLQQDLWQRPSPADFPYQEPSDWETIRGTFPDPDSSSAFSGTDDDLADRILGGWLGRCSGCQLGKPLEGALYPEAIKAILEMVGSWPLEDYMNPIPKGTDLDALPANKFFEYARDIPWAKGQFDTVTPDDDIHYAIVSQTTLERFGPGFTSEQALDSLKELVPSSCLYASGKNAFKNSVFGIPSPYTAYYGNPCRQSLGAMIRCDPFGWGAPANPALAAEMAFKDAVNSQVRNGIYAGIFFAVLMADTLGQGDPIRAIDTALAYVPPKSRFAEMVDFVREQCAGEADWETVNDAIYTRYAGLVKRFNHAIFNGAIVLLGLLKGEGDFTHTLGITVMAGMDTDCTGATVGSILGCALGGKSIPEKWTQPFNNTIRTQLKEMPELKITEMADRMFAIARKNLRR